MINPSRRKKIRDLKYRDFYQALCDVYGQEAANCRHEIFFILNKGTIFGALIVGVLSAFRDIGLLVWSGFVKSKEVDSAVYLVATLPGSNGFESLQSIYKEIKSEIHSASFVIHPRLLRKISEPNCRVVGGISLQSFMLSFRSSLPYLGMVSSVPERLIVFFTVFRFQLWVNSWKTVLASGSGKIFLHNDFDMVSSAAVVAARTFPGERWLTYCVQHGLPTDEFFPAKADYQLVWGETSQDVFVSNGVDASKVFMISFESIRGGLSPHGIPPDQVQLVSQTHTPIYGVDLHQMILGFSIALYALLDRFCVLLHPGEMGNKGSFLSVSIPVQEPPHDTLLSNDRGVKLVVGYSSTALIDAALAGHYVVGINFSPLLSRGAYQIVRPPLCVNTAGELKVVWDRLQDSGEFRARQSEDIQSWLSRTFVDPVVSRRKLLEILSI